MARARALRSDARRNRERVLDIARKAFETDGLGVPIDDIAKRAGLGIGTLYRHFPTKQHLIAAIVDDRMQRLADEAESLARDRDPGHAFLGFLDRLADELARKRDLGDAVASVEMREVTMRAKDRLKAAFAVLLRRAQRAGAIRMDVEITDVITLIRATLPTPDRSVAAAHRLLAVVRDGLRAD
jgi:AcrR family transcriptional regulator